MKHFPPCAPPARSLGLLFTDTQFPELTSQNYASLFSESLQRSSMGWLEPVCWVACTSYEG